MCLKRKITLLLFIFSISIGYSQVSVEDKNAAIKSFNEAVGLVKSKKYKEAIPFYEKAIAKNPEYSKAYYNRGIAYLNTKNYHNAIVDFKKTIEMEPKNTSAYYYVAYSSMKAKDYKSAVEYFSKTLEMDPAYKNVYLNRGISYLKMKDNDKAIPDFSKALEEKPEDVNAYFYKGYAQMLKKDYDNAVVTFTKGLEIDPNSQKLIEKRALANYNNGKYSESIKDYDKVLLKSKDGKHYYKRGVSKFKIKDYTNAITDLDVAIKAKIKLGNANYFKGMCYYYLKNNEEACKSAKAAKANGFKNSDKLIKNVCK